MVELVHYLCHGVDKFVLRIHVGFSDKKTEVPGTHVCKFLDKKRENNFSILVIICEELVLIVWSSETVLGMLWSASCIFLSCS